MRPSGNDPLLLGLGWADEGGEGDGGAGEQLEGQQQQALPQLEAPGLGKAAAQHGQHASGKQVVVAAAGPGSNSGSGSGGWCDGDVASLAVQREVQQRDLIVSHLAGPSALHRLTAC